MELQSVPFVPRSLSSLVLWVVETMNENLYGGGVAGWSAFLLSHGYLGPSLQICHPF